MDPFNIDDQFNAYLKRVGLDPITMPKVMHTELRRAFFGCAGQLLDMLRSHLADLSEQDGAHKLQQMWEEVGRFWDKEAKSHRERFN